MTLQEQIIKCAMIKGMSDRKFPMWGLINAAREQQMLESGQAVIQTDLTGNQVLMPANPTPAPVKVVDSAAVTADNQIAALKKEINTTQGRALASVEDSIRADVNRRFDKLEELVRAQSPK